LEIASAILEVCIEGSNKTKIVYQANLNFKLINSYLDILIKNGLIYIEDGTSPTLYKTTEKGIKFRKDFENIQNIIGEI
jgi:predicted transcriptional regulator